MSPCSAVIGARFTSAGRGRRGVLLLVVLSMLTLFLMLGAAYMAAAGRAREAARAHARLTFGGDDVRTPYGRLLDMVALGVMRGGLAVTAPGSNAPPVTFESLLADKYGEGTLSGTLSGCVVSGPILTATLTTGSARPADLNGRVLTVTQPGRAPTSHRIIRAASTGGSTNAQTTTFTVALDVPARIAPFALPSGTSRAIVNGREFAGTPSVTPPSNEAWDGFDDHNAFLAQVAPTGTMSTSSVSRLSYIGTPPSGFGPAWEYGASDNVPEAADNDGDGVPDGIFLDFGLPDAVDAAGNVVQLRASVLVVDLDGRFNVNAHGSLAPVVYGTSHPGWPSGSSIVSTASLAAVPLGSGYGPVDVAANLGERSDPKTPATVTSGTPRLFDAVQLVTTGTENPKLVLLTGARAYDTSSGVPRMRGQRFAGSRYSTASTIQTPRLRPAEGKYGEQSPNGSWLAVSATLAASSLTYARPGRPNVADVPGTSAARRADPGQPATVNYGVPALWWNATGTFNAAAAGTAFPLPRGVFNSPPDLHGRMKTLTLSATASGANALAPQVVFVQPEWSSATDPREIKDNPYELQLDTRVGFGGCLKDPATDGMTVGSLADNPFATSELEPVLRPYDIDTNRCPPRLVALLGSAGEDSRLKVTTDSWDTTAIVGSAASAVASWLNLAIGTLYGSGPTGGIIGGEVARGERFDLNRPLAASEPANGGYAAAAPYYVQRQAYFKDLYTLLVALEQGGGGALPAARAAVLAQWAANVVEFRDADSRMTPFEYDTNPQNGWSVDGDAGTLDGGSERGVVWGAERPEILIRETLAWDYGSGPGDGGLAVVLHRPWNAVALSASGTIAGEPCDYALDTLCSATNVNVIIGSSGIPGNVVDLGKKSGPSVLTPNVNASYDDVTAGTYPIWRLRIVAGGTSYVRFDTAASAVGSASPKQFAPQTLAAGADKPKLRVDGTLTVLSGNTVKVADADGSPVNGSLGVSGSTCAMGLAFRVPSGQRSAMLYLERLSDPSRAPTAAQWTADPLANPNTSTDTLRYVVVDSCAVTVPDTAAPGATAASGRRASASSASAFWKTVFVAGAQVSAAVPTAPFPTSFTAAERANVNWFPWPNRPFVSAAELVLVPRGDAQSMLDNYQVITEATASAVSVPLSGSLTPARLFDAVHVPTRFAGIHATGTGAALANAGIWATTTTVNQFSSFREPGRVNLNTVTGADVWNTVVGGPLQSVAVPFTSAPGAAPAQSLAGLLGLGAGGGVLLADATASPASLNWQSNPQHRFYTATRLANTVTPRSHVFAVWITLREMVPNDPDSVRYHRAFYIVDRSIPVGFETGRTHNVWDCVRLRRIIE